MAGSFTLDAQSEAFIDSLVESGRYQSAGDVVRAHQVIDDGLASEPGNAALQQLKRRLPVR